MTLTKKQRAHLERRLQEERARALRALNRSIAESASESNEARSGNMTAMPTHQADQGTDTMQQELEASNATRMSQELAEIDAALTRLYETPDLYGICTETGEDISFERLDIIPWARTCADGRRRSSARRFMRGPEAEL